MPFSRKTEEEIKTLRQGGMRLAIILRDLARAARPGVSTKDLDAMAERMIRAAGGDPVFKGYRIIDAKAPFPAPVSILNCIRWFRRTCRISSTCRCAPS